MATLTPSRTAKYKNIIVNCPPREQQYQDAKCSPHLEGVCSKRWLAVPWDTPAHSSVGIYDLLQDPASAKPNMISNPGEVSHMLFNPYNDNELVCFIKNGYIVIWQLPETEPFNGLKPVRTIPVGVRKFNYVRFHPAAYGLIAFASFSQIFIYDLIAENPFVAKYDLSNMIFSFDWSWEGDKFVATCNDQNVYVLDARTGSVLSSAQVQETDKFSYVFWLRDSQMFFSCSPDINAHYVFRMWEASNLAEGPLGEIAFSSDYSLIPLTFDPFTEIVWAGGAGHNQVEWWGVIHEAPFFQRCGVHRTSETTKNLAVMPVNGCSLNDCEVGRIYLGLSRFIEPLHMNLPQRQMGFNKYVYDHVFRAKMPAIMGHEWAAGKNAVPQVVDDPRTEAELAQILVEMPPDATLHTGSTSPMGSVPIPDFSNQAKTLPAPSRRIPPPIIASTGHGDFGSGAVMDEIKQLMKAVNALRRDVKEIKKVLGLPEARATEEIVPIPQILANIQSLLLREATASNAIVAPAPVCVAPAPCCTEGSVASSCDSSVTLPLSSPDNTEVKKEPEADVASGPSEKAAEAETKENTE